MIPRELLNSGRGGKIAELLSFFILEKGMRYQDIFGEEIEGYIEIDGKKHKLYIRRSGIPISAIIELAKYASKFEKAKRRRVRR